MHVLDNHGEVLEEKSIQIERFIEYFTFLVLTNMGMVQL